MTQNYLDELVQLADAIMQLDHLETELGDKREWKAAKEQYDALEAKFANVRSEFVDAVLMGENARETAVEETDNQLSKLREEADASWYPAIDYTRENLINYLSREAKKDPKMRRAQKLAPIALGVLLVVAYFGVRLFSATPITESIEAREGLIQRAYALEKAFRYDDWADTRVRRGGWLKGILLWPIEPTETEIQGAAEFVALVFEGQQYAEGCGRVLGYGDSLSDGQIAMLGEVSDYIQNDTTVWQDPPISTIIHALESSTAC